MRLKLVHLKLMHLELMQLKLMQLKLKHLMLKHLDLSHIELRRLGPRLSQGRPSLGHSKRMISLVITLSLAACSSLPPPPSPSQRKPIAPPASSSPVIPAPPATVTPSPASTSAPAPAAGTLIPATWGSLPGWSTDDHSAAWDTLLSSCRVLQTQALWQHLCAAARSENRPNRERVKQFLERHLAPYWVSPEPGTEGLATGYYEPLIAGSRKPSSRYRYPIYGQPRDLIYIDLSTVTPNSATAAHFNGIAPNPRTPARNDGKNTLPYYTRAQIEAPHSPLRGREIAWTDDPIELFFLQVQGSGRVELDNGTTLRLGFAGHNGHPYRSIGRALIDRGELTPDQASMQGIKLWAQQNPQKLRDLLNLNPRYIFFRELPPSPQSPPGALGVPLTPQRSVAIDPQFIPLGAPLFIATTWPLSNQPLERLVFAQDTGSAIRGAARIDFFWGAGEDASREAGRMKQALKLWLLLPRGYTVPPNSSAIAPAKLN